MLLDYYLGRLKLSELFLEHLAVHKAAWASYHPLLAFDGISRGLIHARLRGGKAHTAEGFRDFYEECARRLPAGAEIRFVRLDRGFSGEETCLFFGKGGQGGLCGEIALDIRAGGAAQAGCVVEENHL